jgi:signal transduction histidine kinase
METAVFDHLQNPVFVISDKNEILYHNFICSQYFKLPPRKLAQIKSIVEIIGVDVFDFTQEIKKCLDSKTPIISPEISFTYNEFQYTMIVKLIPSKKVVLVHMQDFSIEKQLHEKYKDQILALKGTHDQIVRADKLTALGELIAGISHEISSPLMVASDTLLSLGEHLHKKDMALMELDLNSLQTEFTRIKNIVLNMQSLAKNKEEGLEVISLKQCLEKSLLFVKELSLFDGIEMNSFAGDAFVIANEGKLEQVFINLLKNSADALAKMEIKEISIDLDLSSQSVKLHFRDLGAGVISPDEVFDMFYTSKVLGDGTGLGLSISQKIIQSFHGELYLVSSKQGADFCIDFPCIDSESFTLTNRYFRGECEVEDPKLIFYASEVKHLNFVYQNLKEVNVILILSSNQESFQDLCESYMGDFVFSFDKSVKLNDQEVIHLEGLEDEQVFSTIKGVLK